MELSNHGVCGGPHGFAVVLGQRFDDYHVMNMAVHTLTGVPRDAGRGGGRGWRGRGRCLGAGGGPRRGTVQERTSL